MDARADKARSIGNTTPERDTAAMDGRTIGANSERSHDAISPERPEPLAALAIVFFPEAW